MQGHRLQCAGHARSQTTMRRPCKVTDDHAQEANACRGPTQRPHPTNMPALSITPHTFFCTPPWRPYAPIVSHRKIAQHAPQLIACCR
eukprot:112048-Chlamydomonas_euryale.AAC.1